MVKKGKREVLGVRAKAVEMHFLFGFLFSHLDFGNSRGHTGCTLDRRTLEAAIRRAISTNDCLRQIVDEASIRLCIGAPTKGENVIQYYLLLDDPFLSMALSPIEIQISDADRSLAEADCWQSAQMVRFIRLYESGMGMYRVRIALPEMYEKSGGYRAADIVSLADAGSTTSEIPDPSVVDKRRLSFSHENRPVSLFHFYVNDIGHLHRALTQCVPPLLEDAALRNLYRKLSWVEIDKHIVPDPRDPDRIADFQNPYVISCLELPPRDFRHLTSCASPRSAPAKQRAHSTLVRSDIQSIVLRRIEPGETSASFVERYTESCGGDLANMCVSARAFLNMHIRSTAFVSTANKESRCIRGATLPTIVDTLELILMRWYAYVILNRYLDCELSHLHRQFGLFLLDRDSPTITQSLLCCQENIIHLRAELPRVMQVPLSYRRASATSITLYDVGERLFDVKDLQGLLIEKAKSLEELYISINDVKRRIDFGKIEPKLRETLEATSRTARDKLEG